MDEIGALIIRGAGHDRAGARLRLARLLRSVELRPPGASPAAILVVRHLTDPLPGALAAGRGARAGVQWEKALQERLAEFYRRAARPERGLLPANAPAVRFNDEAEALACLALAVSRGTAATEWWAQLLLRRLLGKGAAASLPHLFSRRARLAPAAWRYLAAWRQSAHVLQRITPAQAVEIAAAVAREYALPDVRPLLTPIPAGDVGQRTQVAGRRAEAASPLPAGSPERPAAAAPWASWLPAHLFPPYLGPERCGLLAIVLTLHRRPAATQSPSFWNDLAAWLPAAADSTATTKEYAAPALISIPMVGPASVPDAGRGQAAAASVKAAGRKQTPAADHSAQPQPDAASERMRSHAQKQERGRPSHLSPPLAEQPARPSIAEAERAMTIQPFAGGAATEIGGVLYLVNLMERLDIPARYEAEWRLASQVGAWGVLEALGRALLGPVMADVAGDPLWAALALIDGRQPGQLPAENRQWLATALPFVEQTLQQWLRLPTPAEIARALLLVRGRLRVSALHIDLVMPLEAISMAVRMAGLDVNPGWSPTFGRVIQFHFTEVL